MEQRSCKNPMNLLFILSDNDATTHDLQHTCNEYIANNVIMLQKKRKYDEFSKKEDQQNKLGNACCCIFDSYISLFKHAEKHYIDGKYICRWGSCAESFTRPADLCHHLADIHQLFHICQCKKLIAPSEVESHTCAKNSKTIGKRANRSGKQIICLCTREHGSGKSATYSHIRTWHFFETGFECPYCQFKSVACTEVVSHIGEKHFKIG
jgi:hypothetical protein